MTQIVDFRKYWKRIYYKFTAELLTFFDKNKGRNDISGYSYVQYTDAANPNPSKRKSYHPIGRFIHLFHVSL